MIYYTINNLATDKSELQTASLEYANYFHSDEIARVFFLKYIEDECEGYYPKESTEVFLYEKTDNGTIALSSVHTFYTQLAVGDLTEAYGHHIITA